MPKYLAKGFRNIMLVGMPATGKTDLGRSYAHITGRSFLDFDSFVAKMAGKSVPEIFAAEGEPGFRRWESKALQKLNRRHNSVIACGGGTFASAENVEIIKEMGLVVCLETPVDILAKRILPCKAERPLFKDCVDEKEVENVLLELFEARKTYFEKAQVHLRTGFSSVDNLKLELCNREKKAWGEERRRRLKEVGGSVAPKFLEKQSPIAASENTPKASVEKSVVDHAAQPLIHPKSIEPRIKVNIGPKHNIESKVSEVRIATESRRTEPTAIVESKIKVTNKIIAIAPKLGAPVRGEKEGVRAVQKGGIQPKANSLKSPESSALQIDPKVESHMPTAKMGDNTLLEEAGRIRPVKKSNLSE